MNVTDKAISEIKKFEQEKKSYVRVGIVGKNCSGFVYSFGFDEAYDPEQDILLEKEGLSFVNKKIFQESLDQVIIDYVEKDDKKGFTFTNPLSILGEGCCGGGCSSEKGTCGEGSCNES